MPLEITDGVQYADGERVTDEELAVLRDAQIDAWARELAQIALDELHEDTRVAIEFPLTDVTRFGLRFLNRISEIIESAYTWARGGKDAVPAREQPIISNLVLTQRRYSAGFVDAIRSGALSKAEAVARAKMYAGAATAAFERGRAAQRGLALPAYPTEGCAGLVNCRCYWEIEELPDRIEATWHAVGDKQTCGWCSGNAGRYNPYVLRV